MDKKRKTTICVSIDVWCKLKELKREPNEEFNDIINEALEYLQKERQGVRV